jgi:dTMP kinase
VRGTFITLEGPEGAGKTVVAERLAEALRVPVAASGAREVILTREPGGTALGEQVRAVVLGSGGAIDARADALLFNAARAQLVAEVIGPALFGGDVVVCARFADSTLAYQGYGAGRPFDEFRAIAEIATGGLRPDLTILLDVPPEIGLDRKSDDSRNRFESSFDLAFHRRVRDGFRKLAASEPERWQVIDATRPIETVFRDVLAAALAAIR